jgi:hypothetical protein
MNDLQKEMSDLKLTDRGMIWNSDLVETLELQNCMVNALQVPTPYNGFIRCRQRNCLSQIDCSRKVLVCL